MIGSLIGAAGSFLGGLFGQKQQSKIAKQNIAMQKEFAQSGIQWKVADAKAAGVHPLYALGANTHSFSPISVGSDLATGIANAGQDIGRAIDSTRSGDARQTAYLKTVQDLSVQKMGLENELLASQIAKLRAAPNPPMPSMEDRMLIDGQGATRMYSDSIPIGGSSLVKTLPMERQASDPARPYQEAGAVTDMGYVRTKDGYMPVMSSDAKQRLEDEIIGETAWNLRNRILPSFGVNQTPPNVPVPEGYDAWIYNPFYQEYRPHKRLFPGIYY